MRQLFWNVAGDEKPGIFFYLALNKYAWDDVAR